MARVNITSIFYLKIMGATKKIRTNKPFKILNMILNLILGKAFKELIFSVEDLDKNIASD